MRLSKLKQVGKGVFTRCYELDEDTVLLESFDPIKEAMANKLFPKNKIFPKVEHYPLESKTGSKFYTMYYYKGRPARSTMKWLREHLDADQFEIYMSLFRMRQEVEKELLGKRDVDRQAVWNSAFMSLDDPKLGKLLVKANNVCCSVARNIMFDCAPKNVAAHKGKLILLDCFYSTKELFRLKLQDKPTFKIKWKDK